VAGWGSAVGKIFDWMPGRHENIRNKIDKIKREMDEITKGNQTNKSTDRYHKLSDRLQRYEEKAKNG